ncbi:very short patch repair endonuclease [Mycobacteroides abscessus]|uniref:very short patch repair endonuclease n=1 Tax=Mycobacteroides abscessus TaxID=36809 RepID=UPI000943FB2F|nr:very short patch repair endonuclease [Mycobacteroides abscessus]
MVDSWASSAHTRRSMQGNRSRDTKPEITARKLVHSMGLRYRVNTRPVRELRRTADLVFTRAKVAVFIDGCFWHGCPEHHRQPTANADYWMSKVAKNRARDAETNAALREKGWEVLRFWEHEPPELVATTVYELVKSRRPHS